MRANMLTVGVLGAALAVAACQNRESEQNVVITNDIPADADIEALPADESSATPTEELVNGVDEPAAADVNAANNSY